MRNIFSEVSDVNVFGAFFPAWLISIGAGVVLSLILRVIFVKTGLAPYIGPPALIYPCLVLLLTMGTWILFFGS